MFGLDGVFFAPFFLIPKIESFEKNLPVMLFLHLENFWFLPCRKVFESKLVFGPACYFELKLQLKGLFTQGDFKRGFQMGDFKTRLITYLGSEMKSPTDRNFSICGGFRFGAKLST